MLPASDVTQVRWPNVAIDYGDYHAMFRSGSHAVMFSNFYGRGKDLGIYNLDENKLIKTYKFKENESIVQFGFPYLVSKTKENIIRIWDVNSDSREPIHEVDANLHDIHRGIVHEGLVFIFSTQFVNMTPQYMTIIDCASGKHQGRNKLEGIDPDTAVLFHQKCLILSQIFGGVVTIIPFEDGKEPRTIQTVEDINVYAEGITNDTVEEYKKNVVRHLVGDGNTLVGATSKAIKVWDFQTGALKKMFPTEEPCELYSVQGSFLFGTTVTFESGREELIKVWDTESGNTLLQLKNTSTHPIPNCLWYNHKIYHVHVSAPNMPDTVVNLPVEKKEAPKSKIGDASDDTGKCIVS